MITESSFQKFRSWFWGGVIFLCVLLLFLTCIHFWFFHQDFSRNISDWAYFGDYFAGTVGVLLAALNFLILTYVTIKINMRADQQWLTQLRAPFYKEIIERLYTINKSSPNEELSHFHSWLNNSDFENLLFLVEEREKNEVIKKKDILVEKIQQLYEPWNSDDMRKKIEKEFELAKQEFTNYLAKIMMNKTRK
jgi:hypothetical protein